MMNNMFQTISDAQQAMYDQYKAGCITYYKTWIEPIFNAWCKDIVTNKECKCKCS